MHAMRILQNLILEHGLTIHAKRLTALLAVVQSAISVRCLTLSELGRNLGNTVRVKHNIKRVDRLLGNERLHEERSWFYQALVRQWF